MDPGSAGASPSDQGQREAFLDELGQFLSDKGRYICRSPNLAGCIIDLHDLYNKVTSAGGYQKVTEKGFWEDFLDVYGYPSISTTLAYGLQRIYQLYLEEYEKVHYFGDDEPQPFHRSFPGGYSKYRYQISAHQRMQANMNMLKPSISNYDRVVYSLESCLPNEIDFAVNACTLLSGESRHVLKLPQCKRIIDALLLHAGIVSDGHDSYREILEELQKKTKHDYIKFWNYSVSKKSVLPILIPNFNFESCVVSGSKNGSADNSLRAHDDKNGFANSLHERLHDIQVIQDDESEELYAKAVSKKRKNWSELFHGHRSLGVEDYEGQRVLQIALVLLNLSFEDFNVTLLARHSSLVRFVFLCIHSEYSCLRQTGLDILSNISSHMQLLQLNYDIIVMMFDTINSAILSNDKFERVRGFEILGNICRPRPNLDYVCVHIDDKAYDAAIQNLMIADVELLLAAIEALYRLSKLGESTCTKMLFVKGFINVLVCLVTLNVRMFGPEKLAEIRLARKIGPGQPDISQQPTQPYTVPPAPSPQLSQTPVSRPLYYHHQIKIVSSQQAQPSAAAMVQNPSIHGHAQNPIKNALAAQSHSTEPHHSSAPRMPSTPVQPKVEANPHEFVTNTQIIHSQVSQPAAKIMSTPPSTPPSSVASESNASPPGAGPTYTHSETGTVPPVFHYMPAPPTDIVQDSSPESFTKLWIWATYEADNDSYIPRVDVYCEYLASSNRYGRQGKAEILSATDFGKCLKHIFPSASSRLFNQGRGQPQYHIAGIKKRATPLPVPGYQLKNTSSVFSSEKEYERIPSTTQSVTLNTSHIATGAAVQSQPTSVTTVSVPIQQLQFQPVLIVPSQSSSNVVPGLSTTVVTTSEAKSVSMPCSTAIPLANMGTTVCTVTLSSEVTRKSLQIPNNPSSNVSRDHGASSQPHTSTQHSQTLQVSTPSPSLASIAKVSNVAADQSQTVSTQHNESTCPNTMTPSADENSEATLSNNNKSEPSQGKPDAVTVNSSTASVSENGDENGTNHKPNRVSEIGRLLGHHCNEPNNPNIMNGSPIDVGHKETAVNHVIESNGIQSEEERKAKIESSEDMMMEVDKLTVDKPALKQHKSRTKSKDIPAIGNEHSPLVNGFADIKENAKFEKTDRTLREEVVNGETEAAVNSILEPSLDDTLQTDMNDMIKTSSDQLTYNKGVSSDDVNCMSEDPKTSSEQPAKQSNISKGNQNGEESNAPTNDSSVNEQSIQSHVMKPNERTLPLTDNQCNIFGEAPEESSSIVNSVNTTDQNRNPDTPEAKTIEPAATPTSSVVPDEEMIGAGVTTPTNPIPHSALNERLRNTITRRKNSHVATPTTTNNLPPSVLQQYSYKQDGLAQQIITVSTQQFQQHLQTQRPPVLPPSHGVVNTPGISQVTRKRPMPITPETAPVAKAPRPSTPQPTAPYTPQNHQQIVRHPVSSALHRPPLIPQQHIMAPRPGTPIPTTSHVAPKPKGPTIDLMAPNASLMVLYRNVGKIPFANHMDEKEDAITKSVRLTASLILKNIAKYSNLGRSMVQQHEDLLACVAMSQMDCSPVVAKLLSELNV